MATSRSGKELELGSMPAASLSSFSMDDDKMSYRKGNSPMDSQETLVRYEGDSELAGSEPVVANTEEIALKALHTDDDPSLNPWTFRMYFLGAYILPCIQSLLLFSLQDLDYLLSVQHWPQSSCSNHNQSASRSSS